MVIGKMGVMSDKCIYDSYQFINNRSIGYLGGFRHSFSGEIACKIRVMRRDHHAHYPDNLISLISLINITACISLIPFIEVMIFISLSKIPLPICIRKAVIDLSIFSR